MRFSNRDDKPATGWLSAIKTFDKVFDVEPGAHRLKIYRRVVGSLGMRKHAGYVYKDDLFTMNAGESKTFDYKMTYRGEDF